MKRRIYYLITVLIVMILGLSSRSFAGSLPDFVSGNFGDALWASVIYFGFRFLWVHTSLTRAFTLSLIFCFAIEFSQLYQADWINDIRSTLLGGLILGKGFLVVDLIRYSAGILISVAIDRYVLRWTKESRVQTRKVKNRLPSIVGILGAAAILVIIILMVPQLTSNKQAGSFTITDTQTPEQLSHVSPTGNQIVFDPLYDNMNRGHNELVKGAVVDPDYYTSNQIQRGDIIDFDGAAISSRLQDKELSRVIGLPGETIGVQKGQIYVNGKRLDTFYGRAFVGGIDRETFLQKPDDPNINKENILKDAYDFSMNDITVPEGTVFIVGDDWLRSLDSLRLGPISQSLIKGKVIGVS